MRRNGSMTLREALVLACMYDGKQRAVKEIHERYNNMSKKPMAEGSIHSTLNRMESIGLLRLVEKVKTNHPHGGANKNLYVITSKGREQAEDVEFLASRMHYAFRYRSRRAKR